MQILRHKNASQKKGFAQYPIFQSRFRPSQKRLCQKLAQPWPQSPIVAALTAGVLASAETTAEAVAPGECKIDTMYYAKE